MLRAFRFGIVNTWQSLQAKLREFELWLDQIKGGDLDAVAAAIVQSGTFAAGNFTFPGLLNVTGGQVTLGTAGTPGYILLRTTDGTLRWQIGNATGSPFIIRDRINSRDTVTIDHSSGLITTASGVTLNSGALDVASVTNRAKLHTNAGNGSIRSGSVLSTMQADSLNLFAAHDTGTVGRGVVISYFDSVGGAWRLGFEVLNTAGLATIKIGTAGEPVSVSGALTCAVVRQGHRMVLRSTNGNETLNADAEEQLSVVATAAGLSIGLNASNGAVGQSITLVCANESGGAATFVFGTPLHATGNATPANGFVTLVEFEKVDIFTSLDWYEKSRTTVVI